MLTKEEVSALFQFLDSDMRLLAQLLYATGMRLMEGLRLRIKDVDFDRHVSIVREAKGNKDRVVMLPRSLAPRLRQQLGLPSVFGSKTGKHNETGCRQGFANPFRYTNWGTAMCPPP